MQADRQQQRDPNKGRRIANQVDSSRQIKIRQVHSTESHKYRDEREQTDQVDNSRQQIADRAADSKFRQTSDNRFRQTADSDNNTQQQIQTTPQTADITNQIISDAKQDKIRRN
ncbi:hypothetical protein Tco_0624349 [Tanacetum coccineum]|uniref:Uncharacterized protein n=1 Tax=Tanacetum coccineum TaxID=301880 RepID=A0ABQ4WDM6_9ASTR